MSRLLGNNATSDLRQEISALESLRDQMSGRLKRVKARRAQELYDRSLPGKLWNVVSLALGVYCVYKILACPAGTGNITFKAVVIIDGWHYCPRKYQGRIQGCQQNAACDKQEPCCLPHASSPGSNLGDVSIVNANSTPHIVSTITGCYQ